MSGSNGPQIGLYWLAAEAITRRKFINQALALGALTLGPAALSGDARAQESLDSIAATVAPIREGSRPGTWLLLLGTHAGPGIELARGQPASAVVVDGRPYLVDCGYGTLRQLVASQVGYQQINTVFFTHLHDDHTGDLPALLTYQWTGGKTTATDAYGPYGTSRLVAACVDVIQDNVEIRTADEGRTVDPVAQFHGHDVSAADTPVQVFKDDRISVMAVENTHYPARSKAMMPHRSLALRLETKSRSIVFSGDTAYSANVAKLARGADVLVCEIADAGLLARSAELAKSATAAGHPNNIFRHVAETHASPADVARMASEANVNLVVLNHQLAGPAVGNVAYPVTAFINAVREGYSGEVIVGQDLMVL